MTQSILRALGLLGIAFSVAFFAVIETQAGEQDEVKITGTICKGLKKNGKPKWSLKLEDGKSFNIRTPRERHGFKLDKYVDKKVTLTFMSTTTKTDDGKRKVTLKKTFPIALEEVKEGQKIPPLDPDLEIEWNKPKKK